MLKVSYLKTCKRPDGVPIIDAFGTRELKRLGCQREGGSNRTQRRRSCLTTIQPDVPNPGRSRHAHNGCNRWRLPVEQEAWRERVGLREYEVHRVARVRPCFGEDGPWNGAPHGPILRSERPRIVQYRVTVLVKPDANNEVSASAMFGCSVQQIERYGKDWRHAGLREFLQLGDSIEPRDECTQPRELAGKRGVERPVARAGPVAVMNAR